MAFWNFLVNEEGWTLLGAMAWTNEDGHPPGCLRSGDAAKTVSILASEDDPCSFWYRVISDTDTSIDIGSINVVITINSNPTLGAVHIISEEEAGLPYDTGWLKVSSVLGITEEITSLGIETTSGTSNGYTVYVDTIYIAEVEPDDGGNRIWVYKLNTRTGEIISRGIKT